MSGVSISFSKLVQSQFKYYWSLLATFFPLLTLLSNGLSFVLPPPTEKRPKSNKESQEPDKKPLFPEFKQPSTEVKDFKNVHQCSLTFNTKLVPFKNSNGEMEWKFVEDHENATKSPSLMEDGLSDSLSPFMADSSQSSDVQLMFGTPFLVKPEQEQGRQRQQDSEEQKQEDEEQERELGLGQVGQVGQEQEQEQEQEREWRQQSEQAQEQQEQSPQLQQSSPDSDNLQDLSEDTIHLKPSSKGHSNHRRNRRKRVSGVVTSVINGETFYHCSQCPSKFKFRGYLTRHSKKHSQRKAYHCPFYESGHGKCSLGEGFSRRDTYKVHLKAMHFKYPKGVKCADRTGMMGWCGSCGQSFQNNEIWVERHIEMGVCRGLPEGYSSRIMTRSRKKTGKQSSLLNVASNGVNENPMLKLVMDGEVVSAPKLEDVTQLLGESGSTITWTETSENTSRASSVHDLTDHSSASDSLSRRTSEESIGGSTNDSSFHSLDEASGSIGHGHSGENSLFFQPNPNRDIFWRSWAAQGSSSYSLVDHWEGQVPAQVQAQIHMRSLTDSQASYLPLQNESQKQVGIQNRFPQDVENVESALQSTMPMGDDDFPALDGENAFFALLQQHRQLSDRAKPNLLSQDPLFHPSTPVSWLSQPDLTF